jgi:hypothetical protein
MTPTGQRQHQRFTTCDGKHIPADVRREKTDETHNGSVVDLSAHGARLALRSPVAIGEQLDVGLHVPALRLIEQRKATVCWTALTRDLVWHAGVCFETPLRDATIDSLASTGYIERRKSDRVKVSIPAAARMEASHQKIQVRVADVSSGGFGLISPEPLELDRRVMISVDDPTAPWAVFAHVRSCNRRRRGHAIGCEFVDQDAYRQLCERIRRNRTPVGKSRWSRLRDYAFGVVSAFVCMTAMTHWNPPQNTDDSPSWEQHRLQAVAKQVERLNAIL